MKSISFSDVADIYPSTALQTSFLVAGLLIHEAYITTHAYDLRSGTDSNRLRDAFDQLIDHPNGAMLRTVFVFEPRSNRFLQVLLRPGAKRMQWNTIALTNEVQLDSAIDKYQHGQGSQTFESGELLTRACIFELNGSARALVWTLHHTLQDGWLKDGLDSDIQQIYARRPLPPRRPFKPLIKYLEGLDRSVGLEFWKNKLNSATPTPFLQAIPGAPRAIVNSHTTREIHPGHRSLAREFGIIPSTLATAAWAVVLGAHSGTSDVVFGQVMAGRSGYSYSTK